MYVRKAIRAANNNVRFDGIVSKFNLIVNKPTYIEDEDGFRIRQWGNSNYDYVRDEDVGAWLRNVRVVEDLRSGLEFVRQSYIDMMIRQDYLRWDTKHKFYWVTAKAALRYNLKKVINCDFPR